MSKHSTFRVSRRGAEAQELARMEIEGILKLGSLRLRLMALEAEVEYYTGLFRGEVDPETGHRLVVRNGYMPERDILTPMGSMEVRQWRAPRRPAACPSRDCCRAARRSADRRASAHARPPAAGRFASQPPTATSGLRGLHANRNRRRRLISSDGCRSSLGNRACHTFHIVAAMWRTPPSHWIGSSWLLK